MIYWYSTSRYDEWDNRFFGISDKEAESVDPQQHFVLESVHMALEDAGIPKEKIAGSGTGVFIGLYLISWTSKIKSILDLKVIGTPPYCDVLPIEINKKIYHNFISFFFPAITT